MDENAIRTTLDKATRAKDIPLMQLPGFMDWSERKLDEGVLPAHIAALDSMSMWLAPEEVENVTVEDFEELLLEVLDECGQGEEASVHLEIQPEQAKSVCSKDNLELWLSDNRAWEFVVSCKGRWTDADWEKLVESLRGTRYWPIDPDAVGEALEKATILYEKQNRSSG